MSDKIRKEIQAEIVLSMKAAKARGEDPWEYAKRAFPGIPIGVLTLADLELDGEEEEAWWRSMERTIDGEIIRNALTKKP